MKKSLSLFVICLFALANLSAKQKPGRELHDLLLSYMTIEEFHPDSLESNIAKLRLRRLQSQDAAERAVYAAALGRFYAERIAWRSVGTDLRDSALYWYSQALADKSILAQTKAKRWKPFVVIGKDEDYFGGDMLNVVWRSMVGSIDKRVRDTCQTLPKYNDMVGFYRSQGIRTGAFLLALDSLSDANRLAVEDFLKIRDEYADLPLCAEIYLRLGTVGYLSSFQRREWLKQGIEKYPKYRRKSVLQNALTRLSDPMFQWDGTTHVYPGKQYVWRFRARNVQSVLINGEEHVFPPHDPVETFRDTMLWTAPASGDYTIKFVPQTSAKLTDAVKPLMQSIRSTTLQTVCQAMPDGKVRFLVVDSDTGRPQEGVTIEVYREWDDSIPYFVGHTNRQGKVSVPRWQRTPTSEPEYQIRFRLSRADEPDLPITTIYVYPNRWSGSPSPNDYLVHLYTDRNIYRPGQTVHVGGLVYWQRDWEARPIKDRTYTLELFDANHKSIAKRDVVSDEMGVFSEDFVLPEGGKNGSFQLYIKNKANVWFRVEEYKRPTFEVMLEDSLQTVGDSVICSGMAKTYEGSPLRNSRVTGTYRWQTPWIYYGKRVSDNETLQLDTIETDDNGRFHYTLAKPKDKLSLYVNVDVLSPHGETQRAQHVYWRRWDNTYNPTPGKIDSTFIVRCVPDSFSIEKPARIEVTTNLPDVCLHYTLSAAGKVWTDTMVVISRETYNLDIPYRKVYDQSLTATFCFVKNGRVYTEARTIRLARPDNQLRMRWDTFRNLLQPGQKEEWRLTLLNPDGTPAKANVMMAMYDASLDYFGRHAWNFGIRRSHRTYGMSFQTINWGYISNNSTGWYYQKVKKERSINLTHIDDNLFEVRAYTRALDRGPLLYKGASNAVLLASPVPQVEMERSTAGKEVQDEVKAAGTDEDKGVEEEETISVSMRENFDETAFFYPQLRTNENGQVSISFTLPESLTRWNLMGIAHTGNMNYLNIREEVEARKDLMAQLYLPRFLRPGDETELTASVRNVSENRQQGKGVLQILDAKTEKVLKQWKTNITLDSKKDTVLYFPYSLPARSSSQSSDLIIRWAVEGTTCSDGEQRLMPVLPAAMPVTNTIAITAYNPSVQNIDLSKIFPQGATDRRLTVEYTTHPEQLALQALPPLAKAKHCDILSLTAAYYAGVLGKALGVAMPDSTVEYLNRMVTLQDLDGGFRWYPSMPTSPYLTREVSYLLTRLHMLAPSSMQNSRCSRVNERAVHYLLSQRIDSTYLSAADLRNLYIVLYSGVSLTKDEKKKVDFLMKLAKREDAEEDGYERQALLAIVLKQAGADRKARKCMQLFRKYIVSSPERGSYIEFPKGSFASIDRKLHIHVQLMEALQRMNPQDTLLPGMRRYLLQQKRTQEWSTPINTANAVFALIDKNDLQSSGRDATSKDVLTLTCQRSKQLNFVAQDDTLGYLRDSLEVEDGKLPIRLRLQKSTKGESWGGVFADFQQPFDQIETRSMGLSISQEYPQSAKKGSRYTVRYRISADRDYEYVTLIVPRPAFTEPVNPRSGYGWSGGLGFYRQVHDSTTEFSFYQIPRGDYLIEETLYVERNGRYHSGVSVIRCEYADEFQGHSDDKIIEVVR